MTAPIAAGVRVLVVDDHEVVRRAIRRVLARAGFDVVTAEDVGPALLVAAARVPDIALVDLGMPTSGLELVRRLKADHGAAIHVAVLTGHLGEQASAFDAGADDYLVQPIAPAELQQRVVAAARRQRAFVEARLSAQRAERLRVYDADASGLLAHDINNGLVAALANVEIIKREHVLADAIGTRLDAVQLALDRVAALVTNFIDVGRFEDAVLRPNVARVPVRALLDTVVAIHVPAAGARHVSACVECEPCLEGWGDPALIERMLHNLVANAIRFSPDFGVVHLAARPWSSLDHAAGIEVAIHNVGPQITGELREQIFTKYARGQRGEHGMGLYFCRLACEAHGGSIGLSTDGDGPTFTIRLPGPVHD